ncbi:hypothetical protein [Radicibacter daui]|uniref:hypothetical protein n=1 Tax=Radicibacter daui TaxID=3064829 RepID=UPI0040468A87
MAQKQLWIPVGPGTARQHPLFGAGPAETLLVILLIAAPLLIGAEIRIVQDYDGLPALLLRLADLLPQVRPWFLLVPTLSAAAGLGSWLMALACIARLRAFPVLYAWFCSVILLPYLLIMVAFNALGVTHEAASSALEWLGQLVFPGLLLVLLFCWLPWLFRSRRSQLNFRLRLAQDDPLLGALRQPAKPVAEPAADTAKSAAETNYAASRDDVGAQLAELARLISAEMDEGEDDEDARNQLRLPGLPEPEGYPHPRRPRPEQGDKESDGKKSDDTGSVAK